MRVCQTWLELNGKESKYLDKLKRATLSRNEHIYSVQIQKLDRTDIMYMHIFVYVYTCKQ